MYTRFSLGGSSAWRKRSKITKTVDVRETKRKRIQNELDCWGDARAKDARVHEVIVREVAPSDPTGRRRETYRAMHAQCDRVWAERIQLKKEELAALMKSPSLR
jgi:hypothetical protein